MDQNKADTKRVAGKLAKIRTLILEIRGNTNVQSLPGRGIFNGYIEQIDEAAINGMASLGYASIFGPNSVIRVKKAK
jgi:hypothetical protein